MTVLQPRQSRALAGWVEQQPQAAESGLSPMLSSLLKSSFFLRTAACSAAPALHCFWGRSHCRSLSSMQANKVKDPKQQVPVEWLWGRLQACLTAAACVMQADASTPAESARQGLQSHATVDDWGDEVDRDWGEETAVSDPVEADAGVNAAQARGCHRLAAMLCSYHMGCHAAMRFPAKPCMSLCPNCLDTIHTGMPSCSVSAY